MPRTHRFLTHLEAVSIHSRGYLPHWEAAGATYSVTFRLHDAIAPLVIQDLLERKHSLERAITSGLRELTSLEAMTIRSEIERRFDVALDRNQGSAHMLDPKIAELVARSIMHFEKERYELNAWCVMPNHVHVVVRPLDPWRLGGIIHSWKSFTATRANRLLHRSGPFWQREYFDRIIRDEEDLSATVRYVVENPAKAKLKDWNWTSAGWKPADRQAGSLRSTQDYDNRC